MKTIVLLGIVLVSNTAFAATDCHVVEYPDHYEAICTGDAPPAPAPSASLASPASGQEQAPVQEHTFEALLAAQEQAQLANDGEVTIERSDLAMRHAELWLKTQPQ